MKNYINLSCFILTLLSILSCTQPSPKENAIVVETGSEQLSSEQEIILSENEDYFDEEEHEPFKKITQAEVDENYIQIREVEGDLTNDGVAEKVVVYDTNRKDDEGIIRELHILKRDGNNWEIWKTSDTAIFSESQGGLMGDPFKDVNIANGTIVTKHSGGSNNKWDYTHRYRFQNNEFELIGATVKNSKECDRQWKLDYNLSTGKLVFAQQEEDCATNTFTNQEEVLMRKLDYLPTIENFYPGHTAIRVNIADELAVY